MTRAKLTVALITACVVAPNLCGAEPAAKTSPAPARFANEIHDFTARDRKDSYPRDAILFVGSSSIRLWPTAEAFPELPVINRGFGGSQIFDVNHYFDDIVAKYHPNIIVFYSGDNDTQAGKSSQQIFDDFTEFVSRVHESLPETQIICLPIKPSLARWKLWPQMRETNSLIANLADRDDRLEVVDTATPLLGPDGQPRKDLFLDDGLHLNAKGYAIWNKVLAPVLQQPRTAER